MVRYFQTRDTIKLTEAPMAARTAVLTISAEWILARIMVSVPVTVPVRVPVMNAGPFTVIPVHW